MSTQIRDLVAELFKYKDAEDKILPLLKSFLYSEHYATQLCEENNIETTLVYKCNGQITGKRSLTLSEMIAKLIDKSVIDQEINDIFTLLNKIRNRLIHDISPDTQKITKWIGDFNPPTNQGVLDMLKNATPWLRFYLCLIPAINGLYSKTKDAQPGLLKIEYNTPTGNWILHFE